MKTAQDFIVGQKVRVDADQGIREGVVTKIGRTRVTVRHPRNKRGDMVERAYRISRIVIHQERNPDSAWPYRLLFADGYYGSGSVTPWPNVPIVPRKVSE